MDQPTNIPQSVSFGSLAYQKLLDDLQENPLGLLLIEGPSPQDQEDAATVLARDLSASLYRIDLSAIISKYIGNTERELAEHLSQAAAQDSMLLLAGADALFGKRVEVDGCFLRYRDTEANRLFQLGVTHQGIVLAGSATLPEGPGPWDGCLTAVIMGPPSTSSSDTLSP